MKELWNKLIKSYLKNQKVIQEKGNRWIVYLAEDENRKIQAIFQKTFHKNIEECNLLK